MHLINWKARRAGGRITINGTDGATGNAAKIVGVDVIEPGSSQAIVARDKYGDTHTLAVSA